MAGLGSRLLGRLLTARSRTAPAAALMDPASRGDGGAEGTPPRAAKSERSARLPAPGRTRLRR